MPQKLYHLQKLQHMVKTGLFFAALFLGLCSCNLISEHFIRKSGEMEKQGNTDKAIRFLLAAEVLDKKNPDINLQIAAHYLALEQEDWARTEYYKAMNKNTSSGELVMACIGMEIKTGNYWSALSLFRKLDMSHAKSPDLPYALKGLAYFGIPNYDSVIVYFDQAIHHCPDRAVHYIHRGYALAALERYPEALADYRTAVSIDSLRPDVFLNKADLWYILEDYPRALVNYNLAMALMHNRYGITEQATVVYHNRARTYLALGDTLRAMKDQATASDLGPVDPIRRFDLFGSDIIRMALAQRPGK